MELGTVYFGGSAGTNSESFTVNDAIEGTVHGFILSSETHATYRAANGNEYTRFTVRTAGNVVTGTISANHSANSTYYSEHMVVGAVYIEK